MNFPLRQLSNNNCIEERRLDEPQTVACPSKVVGTELEARCRGSAAQPPIILTAPHHRMTYRTSPPLPSPPTNQPTHSFPPLLRLQLLPISRAAPPRRRLPPFPTSPAGLRSCSCRRPIDSPLYLLESSPWP